MYEYKIESTFKRDERRRIETAMGQLFGAVLLFFIVLVAALVTDTGREINSLTQQNYEEQKATVLAMRD